MQAHVINFSLVHSAMRISSSYTPNGRMTVKDELEGMWKDAVVVNFDTASAFGCKNFGETRQISV